MNLSKRKGLLRCACCWTCFHSKFYFLTMTEFLGKNVPMPLGASSLLTAHTAYAASCHLQELPIFLSSIPVEGRVLPHPSFRTRLFISFYQKHIASIAVFTLGRQNFASEYIFLHSFFFFIVHLCLIKQY